MAKANNNPRRQPPLRTVQFWLSLAGGWLLLTGLVGGLAEGRQPDISENPIVSPGGTSLRVTEGRQQPGSVVDQLQNAGGLQRQTGPGLQQPTGADTLQPNAKTDSLDSPAEPKP